MADDQKHCVSGPESKEGDHQASRVQDDGPSPLPPVQEGWEHAMLRKVRDVLKLFR